MTLERWSLPRLLLHLAVGLCAWLATAALCLYIGSTGNHWPHGTDLIFRRESVLTSSLIGAALAAAGVAYQAVLRNPLADPYLLGASSGAALAAYLWQLPALTALLAFLGPIAVAGGPELFAFIGALAAVTLVLLITTGRSGQRRLDPVTLLLVGVIINAVNGAIYLLLNAIIKDFPGSGGETAIFVGGIRDVTHIQFVCAAALITIGWFVLLWFSGPLTVSTLGEAEAQSLGINMHRLRWIILIAASLITAAAVAISGPIAFVGLICPHVARRLVGSDQRRLLPAATATGAILLCLADAASRGLARLGPIGTELPVGILTGLLGGPFFLALLIDRDRT